MPSYTIMNQSGRQRLLRTDPTPDGATSTVVTTFPAGAHRAGAVAKELTDLVADIPHAFAYYVLDELDCEHLDPQAPWSPTDWENKPAPTAPFSLRRRVLNALDGTADIAPSGSRYTIAALRQALVGQPESVRRAVREEVSGAFAPYEGVPVLARVYDRKYDECNRLLLANAGLALLDDAVLTRVRPYDGSDIVAALDRHALADFDYADATGAAGYLSVTVNDAQLTAWRAARQDQPPTD